MRRKGRALRRRYGRAGAKTPMDAFRAAARKVEKAIAHLAAGGSVAAGDFSGNIHEDSRKVSAMVNRLEDRASKPEIRGDDAIRDEAWAIVSDLRKKKIAADETGFKASQDARYAEIGRIKQAERDARATEYERDPALAQYKHELALERGRRK